MPQLHRVTLTKKQLNRLILLLEDDIQDTEDANLLNMLNIPLKTIDDSVLNFKLPFRIRCEKEEHLQLLEELFERNGCTWSGEGKFIKETSFWDIYENETCYFIKDRTITFSQDSFYLDKYEYNFWPVHNIEDLLI